MARLKEPQLAPGSLLQVIQELRRLHAEAGWPSTRELADELSVSHTKVYDLFTKAWTKVPDKMSVTRLARVLMRRAMLIDSAKDVEANLAAMWDEADKAPFRAAAVAGPAVSARTATGPMHDLPLLLDSAPALGATRHRDGTMFAVFSEIATRVQLCFFDDKNVEFMTFELARTDDHVWYVKIAGVDSGLLYGYRVHGPDDPPKGLRCNPKKLLLDPYTRAVHGPVHCHVDAFTYRFDETAGRNDSDSAAVVPKSVVVYSSFDWQGDQPPRTSYDDTVIYEAHVRGLTCQNTKLPEDERGTFIGLASPTMLQYYRDLGVTAVQLMPVQQFVHAHHLVDRGLSNYWGYDTIGFFAPHNEYARADGAPGAQVDEFKEMVRRLHADGIEVIVDVVFNHTGEGNHLGPTLSMRGIDNRSYYRLDRNDRGKYSDFTDTGNTVNAANPRVLQLITDALRYWVTEMHVDGFRFDLAAALTRDSEGNPTKDGTLLTTIQQDPVLSQVKLIAEPWDTGPDGYRLGTFPHPWREWNDCFRDGIRKFWGGWENATGDFASRLSGSADLYQRSGRRSTGSVNFVTCHDGFTLADLVSYRHKRNEANSEGNDGGQTENYSRAWGTDRHISFEEVDALRARVMRALMATMAISRGTPMILHGDELGRTQRGNNNAYCQDNELTWVDWSMPSGAEAQLSFTRQIFKFRRRHPAIRRYDFTEQTEMVWFSAAGNEMSKEAWRTPSRKYVALYLTTGVNEDSRHGGPYLMLFNASDSRANVILPNAAYGRRWAVVVDTYVAHVVHLPTQPSGRLPENLSVVSAGAKHRVGANSLQVLHCVDRWPVSPD